MRLAELPLANSIDGAPAAIVAVDRLQPRRDLLESLLDARSTGSCSMD